ncbi:SUMF1/EgtB/PvdO family nonheme iron enzyme, partial [Citrobacter freundii]|nr:SUMF1/EgtB/PvdO family nonheme iron enzyme [Citrobacter freundii]
MTAHILKLLTPGIFLLALTGCDNSTSAENQQLTQALVKRSLDNMVPVAGGEFLMGDFGPLIGEKLPFSSNQDDKYLHKVRLSDFMIGKYKVTHKDYNEYIKITHGKKLTYVFGGRLLADDVPVSIPWQMAKDYCLWLGKMSGKRVDLPTEAQWEYAARSRGQYLPYATSNGKIERGVNVPTFDERAKMNDVGISIYPVGKYPPNPLGLYDMGLSGDEWANDWYAADYYTHSPVDNPQGP